MTDMTTPTTPPVGTPPAPTDAISRLLAGLRGDSNGLVNPMSLIAGILGGANGGTGGKSKGAAKQLPGAKLPSLENVPTATTGFYQQQTPDQRTALLQSMIARARGPAQPAQQPNPMMPTNSQTVI